MKTHAHDLTDREIAMLDRIAKRSYNLMGEVVHSFLSGCAKKGFPLGLAGAALSLLLLQTAVKVLMMCSRVPPDEIPMDEVTTISAEMQKIMAKQVGNLILSMENKEAEGN